jgi:hypothetical protein
MHHKVSPYTSLVSIHKNNKINLPFLQQFLPGAGKWQFRLTLSVNALYYKHGDRTNFVFVLSKFNVATVTSGNYP